MNLKLEQYHTYISEDEIPCDASRLFFDRRNKNCKFSFSDGCAIFYARFGKIFKGEEAIFIQVVNTDDGELYEYNARKGMHNLLLKHALYPQIILNALIKK